VRGDFPERTFMAESYWLRNIGPMSIKESEVEHYLEHGSQVVEYTKAKILDPIEKKDETQ